MMWVYKLLSLPVIGKRCVKKYILKFEKGEIKSNSIREYYEKKHNMNVGMYSYGCFEPGFNFANAGKVVIGRYCSFGPDVHYFGADHPLRSFSTSPIFYRKSFGFDVQDVQRYQLTIGNDVWCGYGAYFTCGCHHVGNGAVIAAGSVVTKDVPPYAIVGGVPAKVISYRFDEETIASLEKSRWYELEPTQVMKFYRYANDPLIFSQMIQKEYYRYEEERIENGEEYKPKKS